MPTRRTKLQEVTLLAPASNITFSAIPQTYSDLVIHSAARTNRANANGDVILLRPNGATANLTNLRLVNSASSVSSSSGSVFYAGVTSTTSQATDYFGFGYCFIPNYTGTGDKVGYQEGSAEMASSAVLMSFGGSRSTNSDPITSITLLPESGTQFEIGSTFYLYGITHVPIINGGEVSIRGGFKYHTFRSTGALQVVEPGDVEYLVVAGGGGGGAIQGGGGGAGGMLVGRTRLVTGVQSVSIGAGGTGAVGGGSGADRADSGSSSSAFSITSTGGGGGGSYNPPGGTAIVGRNGGSGGGGGSYFGANPAPGAGGSGTSGQGNNGGQGNSDNSTYRSGGGGGGAGAAGSAISNSSSFGHGGIGLQWPSGSGTYYAGGGGGGSGANAGNGGAGGGGTGSVSSGSVNPGVANTGGGGGSSGNFNINGGNGGSGIVIIRYPYDGN